MTNKLQELLDVATPEEVDRLARMCSTSPAYLHHLARQYGGGRKPSVVLALDLERATRMLRQENRKLPLVSVEDIGAICGWERADK